MASSFLGRKRHTLGGEEAKLPRDYDPPPRGVPSYEPKLKTLKALPRAGLDGVQGSYTNPSIFGFLGYFSNKKARPCRAGGFLIKWL